MVGSAAGQIAALSEMSVVELQTKYQELLGGKPSSSGNRAFLMRRIAWQMQESAGGGLSAESQRRLSELGSVSDPLERFASRQVERLSSEGAASRRRDKRLPRPGTVLSRNYRGRAIEVKVLEKGFEFEGRVYRSLSAIADVVTGAHWNGFVFFNL